ncbi:MAG: methylated-DNA--[protein]-cysteine S-methyltransferase [Solirubrobacteraceae bacterium]
MSDTYTLIPSPIGELLLAGARGRLRELSFRGEGAMHGPARIDPRWRRDEDAFPEVRAQLREYFAGARREFEVELELLGSEWERRVWDALLGIAYGETRSYGQVAAQLGSPGAARAVGLANGRNPVAVIVPCHRVIGAGGRLTGYGGGLQRKRMLLDLESGRPALI